MQLYNYFSCIFVVNLDNKVSINQCRQWRNFVVKATLKHVRGHRITEKPLLHSQDITSKVATIFSNTERFRYLSSSLCFIYFANYVGRESATHSSRSHFHDVSSTSSKSWFGKSVLFISTIGSYVFRSVGVVTIMLGIKNNNQNMTAF